MLQRLILNGSDDGLTFLIQHYSKTAAISAWMIQIINACFTVNPYLSWSHILSIYSLESFILCHGHYPLWKLNFPDVYIIPQESWNVNRTAHFYKWNRTRRAGACSRRKDPQWKTAAPRHRPTSKNVVRTILRRRRNKRIPSKFVGGIHEWPAGDSWIAPTNNKKLCRNSAVCITK